MRTTTPQEEVARTLDRQNETAAALEFSSDRALAVLGEANCYIANFIESYNDICIDYVEGRANAGFQLTEMIRKKDSANAKAQLSAEFVELTIRANLEHTEKMFGAFNALMANMMSLISVRVK